MSWWHGRCCPPSEGDRASALKLADEVLKHLEVIGAPDSSGTPTSGATQSQRPSKSETVVRRSARERRQQHPNSRARRGREEERVLECSIGGEEAQESIEVRKKIKLGNPAMASYSQNYGRVEDSYYHNVNGVEENVSVDTLKSVKVNEDTHVEYWSETAEELEVFQTEPYIIIAQDEDEENEMKIEVISERPEEPIIFYTADIFVFDDHDVTKSFVLEVPNELLSLKESVHVSLPKAI
ncbi:hypothetical protein Scep_030410 [Stephania cephalantha]|uniref:Uncharacterized protein n=1 Tax=Stephania cephalantha TaxID=152367 RepID=A0AAP0HEB7_9MAGN